MLFIGIILASALQSIHCQSSATTSFKASATIIQPISVSTVSNMNFAGIDAKSGGKVILTPDDSRISSGAVELAGEANLSAATFVVSGQSGYTYAVNLPDSGHTLSNGSEQMLITDFTSNTDSKNYLSEGSQLIRVGATLHVNPNQLPGVYSSPAPLHITVNYN